MKQAIIYTRFSPRPDADTSKSCEKQQERCVAYCKKMKYEVYAMFHDPDISGKILLRPGLNVLLDVLTPGMVVVVDTGDRLARDMLIELTIVAQIEGKGCTIEYADGSATRSTPEGKLFRGILSAFAQYERERFAARTKAGLAKKKEAGQWLGRPPVGWTYDKRIKHLVENPVEQAAIAFIEAEHNLGKNAEEIAKFTNARYPGAFRGKLWSARLIRKILKNLGK